jgi:predicted phosphodiesterase
MGSEGPRLAILADIHGNLPALEVVLADLAGFGVDHIVVAGDVVNWGPFSREVIELVAGSGWPVIRGNNEFYLLDYGTPRAPAAWSDRQQYALLPWLFGQLGERWRRVVATWPDTLSLRYPAAPPLRIAHGTPSSAWATIFADDPDEQVIAQVGALPEDWLIVGHTHLPFDRTVGRVRILNPGSVGVPLDGTFSASYVILDGTPTGWRPTFRRVPFDRQAIFAEFDRQGFLAACGVIGQLVLAEFRTARIQLYPFAHWRQACHPNEPPSPELLAGFTEAERLRFTPRPYLP